VGVCLLPLSSARDGERERIMCHHVIAAKNPPTDINNMASLLNDVETGFILQRGEHMRYMKRGGGRMPPHG
jgi:hypothetical protein